MNSVWIAHTEFQILTDKYHRQCFLTTMGTPRCYGKQVSIKLFNMLLSHIGLPWWLNGKDPPANAGDSHLIPGSERSLREGNGNPLQYSCLRNPRGT